MEDVSVHTAGTAGDIEPAYCYAVNCLVQDGSAVWLMQIADQFYPLQYTAGAVYKVGDYVQAAYGSPFWKAQSGGVAGRNGLPGRCSLGQIVNDGSLDWKCYTALWAPNFPYKAHEVVNSPNLYNHNDKQVYAAADCISGNTEPSWDYREGAPTSGDGITLCRAERSHRRDRLKPVSAALLATDVDVGLGKRVQRHLADAEKPGDRVNTQCARRMITSWGCMSKQLEKSSIVTAARPARAPSATSQASFNSKGTPAV